MYFFRSVFIHHLLRNSLIPLLRGFTNSYFFLPFTTLHFSSCFYQHWKLCYIFIFVWYSSVSISRVSIFILICHSLYGIQPIFLIYKWLTNLSQIFIFTWGGGQTKKTFLGQKEMTYTQKWLMHKNKSFCQHCVFVFCFSQLLCSEILGTEDHKAHSLAFLLHWRLLRFFQKVIPAEHRLVEGIQKLLFFFSLALLLALFLSNCILFFHQQSSFSFRSLFHGFSLSRHHPSREEVSVLLDSDDTILFLLFSKNWIK